MKLRYGYLASGIVTGILLLFSFVWTLPDGKMHVVFCDVGQGDGAYIRFPDGRDMVIDGGPDNSILQCLGRHMPFWDRHIDLLVMTHPQKDHMQGLIDVVGRFSVEYFLRSDTVNNTEGYKKLTALLARNNVIQRFVTQDDRISVGPASLSVLWPSKEQITKGTTTASIADSTQESRVLGAKSIEMNDFSVVLELQYGSFSTIFTGDADSHVQNSFTGSKLSDADVEVLKVPHHGSKTGMTRDFIDWISPKLAVVSVGKNSYGHPTQEAQDMLNSVGSRILRTDQHGDIEVITDGIQWTVRTLK